MDSLRELLIDSIRFVPRYAHLEPDLASFPVINKQLLLDNIDAHLSDVLGDKKENLRKLMLSRHLPGDLNFDYYYGNNIYVEQTSGSSGVFLRIPKTIEERSRLALGIWRHRRRLDGEFSPNKCYPFDHAPQELAACGNPYDLGFGKVDELYMNLSTKGMRWIHGRSQTLCRHATSISREVAACHTVRFAENTGYTLTAEDRRTIEAGLNVSMVDQYGCRETWAIAYRTGGQPFEVLAENVVVEILDEDGIPVRRPDVEGRIVVTSLHQRIFPMIRYDTNDRGMWVGHSVGRGFRLAGYRDHCALNVDGKRINGNEFARSVINAAHKEVGFERLLYIQIRQLAHNRFEFVIGGCGKAQELCDAVSRCWNSRVSSPVVFELLMLTLPQVEEELKKKADLFTSKYIHSRPIN